MILPMLAQTWKGQPLGEGWIAEPKLDGVRAVWDGKTLWARNDGKRPPRAISNPPEVLEELRRDFPGVVLDGELVGRDWNEAQSVTSSRRAVVDSNVNYFVFDYLGANIALAGKPWRERRHALCSKIAREGRPYPPLPIRVWFVPTREVMVARGPLFAKAPPFYKPERIAQYFSECGYEGAMFKLASSPYTAGVRSPNWLKLKLVEEVTATIVGAELGEGRLSGTLGTLILDAGDGNRFRVGTGFSDRDRAEYWDDFKRGKLLGKSIDLEYQPHPKIDRRFPRGVRIR